MNEEELKYYIHSHTQPSIIEIEAAKRIALAALHSSTLSVRGVTTSDNLISHVLATKSREKGPIPEGYLQIEPDLNQVKWKIAAREAIQVLQSTGIIVGIGSPLSYNEEQSFGLTHLLLRNTDLLPPFEKIKTFGLLVEILIFRILINPIFLLVLSDVCTKALKHLKEVYILAQQWQ